jgi:hypothetical protein
MELKSNVLTTRAKYLSDFYGFLRIFMFFAGHGGMASNFMICADKTPQLFFCVQPHFMPQTPFLTVKMAICHCVRRFK